MTWYVTDSVEDFLTEAGDFLRSFPAPNTILLSTVDTIRAQGPAAFGDADALFGCWRTAEDGVTAAFQHTPPFPLVLTGTSHRAARSLAGKLAEDGRHLPGVNAVETSAEVFAGEWQHRTGAAGHLKRRTRLYRLGQLAEPRPAVPGNARVAREVDADLVFGWHEELIRELDESVPKLATQIEHRMSYGGQLLWEVAGTPVSMAAFSRPIAGMARVLSVYTPRDRRRQGYGSAVTAAVTRELLDRDVPEVVLFTDLANPTSNAIYQRLGYEPVEDRAVLSFGAG